VPADPAAHLASHRPTDYWGRGLVDQVIAKLPSALAAEGVALLTITSLLSHARTSELLAELGLREEVVAWDVHELPSEYRARGEHLAHIEALSDAYRLHIGEDDVLVTYLLEIRRAETVGGGHSVPGPWSNGP
jgi:hypothetical protein